MAGRASNTTAQGRTHAAQNAINQNAQLAQRMRLRNPFFQSSVAEQGVMGDVARTYGVERKSCFLCTIYIERFAWEVLEQKMSRSCQSYANVTFY